jgi:membrane protease YdiL (CAAX protease family)
MFSRLWKNEVIEKRKSLWSVSRFVLLLLVFQQFASKIGGFIADSFSYNQIDEFDIFAWNFIHHIVQMLIALAVIWVIAKLIHLDFGFRLGNVRLGIKHTAIFTVIILIYVLTTYFIGYSGDSIHVYHYPLDIKNVAGTLGFQLLLSGTSEEILFRALPITLLVYGFGASRNIRIWKLRIPFETIIAAFLFSIAHISWRVNPFSISVDWFQMVYALILGIFYGVAYQQSKSIIYSMAMHSISNVLMVGIGYIFAVVYK